MTRLKSSNLTKLQGPSKKIILNSNSKRFIAIFFTSQFFKIDVVHSLPHTGSHTCCYCTHTHTHTTYIQRCTLHSSFWLAVEELWKKQPIHARRQLSALRAPLHYTIRPARHIVQPN